MRSRAAAALPATLNRWELPVVIAATLVLAGAMHRYGGATTAFIVLMGVLLALATISPFLYAVATVAVAPLPAPDAIVGVSLPVGFEPVNVLALIGAMGVSLRLVRHPADRTKPLVALLAINLALLGVAWARTYAGEGGVDASELALIVKPVVLICVALVLAYVIPRAQLARTLATAMAVGLALVSVSVVLQKAGIYQSAFQAANLERLDIKQYGGILLDGNQAGALLAIFSVPVFILLRDTGRFGLGLLVLAMAFPVLLITLSRGAMVAFATALLVLAVIERHRVSNALVSAGVAAMGVGYALTAGQEQTRIIVTRFAEFSTDRNAQLSGRESIWSEAFHYLDLESSRWLIGGGLDDFRAFAETTSLGQEFATHNAYLFALTSGGAIMLVAFLALLLWLLIARLPGSPSVRSALRMAVVPFLVVGLSSDLTLMSPTAAWLWILAAATCLAAAGDAGGDASSRPARQSANAMRLQRPRPISRPTR